MNILVACEESQAVCKAFRDKGHNAFSCDILECSGGFPEWHIKDDVLSLLDGCCTFVTMSGQVFSVVKWDMIIAFPPCTYLTVTGNSWFDLKRYGKNAVQRYYDRIHAIEFFMEFALCDCDKVAIENPVGIMSGVFRKPNQIIHPYMFGDAERKSTCLWLKGLPELIPTDIVEPNVVKYKNGKGTDSKWHVETLGLPADVRSRLRSKTFPGIARAMAEQWG